MKERPFTEILNGLCSATTVIILLILLLFVSNIVTYHAGYAKGYQWGRSYGVERAEQILKSHWSNKFIKG